MNGVVDKSGEKHSTGFFLVKLLEKSICTKATLVLMLCFWIAGTVLAAPVTVNSLVSLQTAINSAKPGDQIIMADGIYTANENISVTVKGSASKPITISAKTIGGVEIKGIAGFVIDAPAEYIVIKGFKFTHNTGIMYIRVGATHCVVTRNVFECAPVNAGTKAYLTVQGDDNEVSYNTFQNKTDEGQMLSVQGPGGDKMAKRTWVHHNYFYNFPNTKNNCAAIQIGLSGRSMDSAFCIVEYNLFVKTAGENEGAICHKSSKNIIRYNTFGEGSEELSLRHGNGSQVYGNFFMGSTGLRFSADDHIIYSNFFKGCSKAIVCTNGDGEVADGAKLTCHDRSDRVKVVYNTLVDCKTNFMETGRKNGLGATYITFSNNIVQGGSPISVDSSYKYAVWEGNILWNTTNGSIPSGGYTIVDPKLVVDANGVYRIQKGSPAIGAGIGKYPFVTIDMDGQARGTKLDAGADQFSSGKVLNHPLTASEVGPNADLR
jgi:poly(beta-D-mannuronate) lyase